MMAFLTFGDEGKIGRKALAKRTGLGEGATRTVLKRLTEDGYLRTSAGGGELTGKGRVLYGSIRKTLSGFVMAGDSQLTLGRSQAAVVVRGGGANVKNGIEQRDSATRLGASGATTYVMSGGRFTIPGSSTDCERDFPSQSWSILREGLSPLNGDAVVLCGAGDEITAKLGALAAAASLL
jgi:hypothetical protein